MLSINELVERRKAQDLGKELIQMAVLAAFGTCCYVLKIDAIDEEAFDENSWEITQALMVEVESIQLGKKGRKR